jgi:formylglycine-generating enzyme required for sulfatase activity
MEWMYAAKGGTQSPSSGYSTYAGSSVINNVAWYASNSGGTPHNVGTKSPNELGIYDMSGNIREWGWGFLFPYSTGNQTDPRGDEDGNPTYRVLRGGDWSSYSIACTVSVRQDNFNEGSENYFGFRIVRGNP